MPAIPLNIVLNNLKPLSKQPAQPIFLAEPLTPTAAPSSLPWERARERATSRKACIWAVRLLGKIAEIRGMPSPQPSPTGEGADCSRFRRCRSSEKRMPETSTAGIFQAAFIARQMEQMPQAFFQTTFEPIGRVCAARRTRWVGVQGKWRTRACVPHTPYIRATACWLIKQGMGRKLKAVLANKRRLD